MCCWERFNSAFQPTNLPRAFAAMEISSDELEAWFPDSHATSHMTGDEGNFTSPLSVYTDNDTVMVGDGNLLAITYIGDASISTAVGPVILKNVLYVSVMTKNLLSVSQFTKDNQCDFIFNDLGFKITDGVTRRVVASGLKQGDLNVLQQVKQTAFFSNIQQAANEETWNLRMAHCSNKILKQLNQRGLLKVIKWSNVNTICSSYQVGRSAKLPFCAAVINSVKFGDKFCDLWGPAPVSSHNRYKYYASFVDEFTKFIRLFPGFAKSDFDACYIKFESLLLCQHVAVIKVFEADGGGEFSPRKPTDHLAANGILHQFPCRTILSNVVQLKSGVDTY